MSEDVRHRQFHVLSLQPEHHDTILTNHGAVKDSIKAIQQDMTETEILFHSRSLNESMEENFVDKTATNVSDLSPVMYRNGRDGRGRRRGGDTQGSGSWKGSRSREPRRHTHTHERYYKLRAIESREDRRYTEAIELHGASAAIQYLDKKHIWEKIFHDAQEKQKKQSRQIRKLEKKDGQRGAGPLWAGANEPHLGPGTYNAMIGDIDQMLVDERVSLPVRASFRDSRKSERASFLGVGGVIDTVDDKEEITNAFSKRSAKSTICKDGVLHTHKRPTNFNIKKSTARPRNKEEGLRPEDFLRKVKARELKNTPKDFSMGVVPEAYDGSDQSRPKTTHAILRSKREGEASELGTKIDSLKDKSFASTGEVYKKWKKVNGVKIYSSIPKRSESEKKKKKKKKGGAPTDGEGLGRHLLGGGGDR
ncbi:hypothetical protein TrRE_jg3823 [Triparma retinervis]|uniref:Uncharacterized protein n=1 Tax=Triparma retinervis TaxID=2557542 RepID=A0A9W7E775_9STRA|nr:hypothetical protein TrRE_jg3823 [Triparma retinervis]